ncbi:MAG: hypothetical protein LBO80_03890 [Treponema sp.]|jgi:hypothetical protein|nr:hypothetical protein [Treponema sp.]
MFRSFVKMVKIRRILPACILALSLFFFPSCKQDAIFFDISQEVEPKDPRIEGTPSKIVRFPSSGIVDITLYVANGRLHRYKEGTPAVTRGTWDSSVGQPPGGARTVAATTGFLYAITGNGNPNSFQLYRSGDGNTWPATFAGSSNGQIRISYIQSIFGAGEVLFICTGPAPNCVISYLKDSDNSDAPTEIPGLRGLLTGAILDGSDYYLAVSEKGIYTGTSESSLAELPGSSGKKFQGPDSLINANGTNYALTTSGIWKLSSGSISPTSVPFSFFCSALYPNPLAGTPSLLLLGTDGGYGAYAIDPSGAIGPPNVNGSMPDGTTGFSSLEDNVVNYLYVLSETSLSPYSAPVIFASTQREGLWSYRNGEWNAED